MLSTADRKKAAREYKERKPNMGVFAVRCTATAATWVGSTRNLDAARNSFWFGLRLGNHKDKSLQAEWNAHGERSFEYEILEKFDEDATPLAIPDLLKDRKSHWAAALGARPVL